MSSSPRRSGFRLPWLSDDSGEEGTEPDTAPEASATPEASAEPAEAPVDVEIPSPTVAASAANPEANPRQDASADLSNPFLVNLVSAMRGVVDEARASANSDLESQLEARLAEIRAQSSERINDLRQVAEREIAAVGDWSTAEMERIRREAAQRVEARQRQLEQQLAAETEQTEREVTAMRQRITEYEHELSAFYAQLSEINDPVAFVTAAKKVPAAPRLSGPASTTSSEQPASAPPVPQGVGSGAESPAQPPPTPESPAPVEAQTGEPKPRAVATSEAVPTPAGEAASTEKSTAIVVKGLGSFGAITSFKQSLEGAEGIGAVSLSLGPTGEFVYRATHEASADLVSAITRIENGAEVEEQPDGSLRVTVHRGR
jgi:hypothetical protein